MKVNKGIIAIVVLAILLIPTIAVSVDGEDEVEAVSSVLIDMGNGETYWIDADRSETKAISVLEKALDETGLSHSLRRTPKEINGIDVVKTKSVTAQWNYYVWSENKWVQKTLTETENYSGENIAIGFYPSSVVPTETPDYKSSWTMIRGNAKHTGHQTTNLVSVNEPEYLFEKNYGNNNFVNGAPLVAGDKVFFVAGGGNGASDPDPTLYCYDRFTFEEKWEFVYPKGAGYETTTGLIVGGFYYLPATNGTLYRIPLDGPGTNDSNVKKMIIPMENDHTLIGNTYATGPATLSYDSGVIYFGISIGYVYCVDMDLNLLWKTAVGGCVYFNAVAVNNGLAYVGAYNGDMYIIDARSGSMLISETVYSYEKRVRVNGKYEYRTYGHAGVAIVSNDQIYVSFDEGQGMNTTYGGIASYKYDRANNKLTKIFFEDSMNMSGNYLLVNDAGGIYFSSARISLGELHSDGSYNVLKSDIESIKAPLTLVNGDTIVITEYKSYGYVYFVDLDGNVKGKFKQTDLVAQWAMSPVTIIDDYKYAGTDGGFYAVNGNIETEPIPTSNGNLTVLIVLLIILIILVAIVLLAYHIKKSKGVSLITYIRDHKSLMESNNENQSRTKKNKKRLVIMLVSGAILSFIMFMCCLSFGPSGTIPMPEALSSLISAISKHGEDLTYNEIIVFESRLPRAIAALGVGMGLAVAGSIYQAIIRNPLVDPYIMGVSSGAGTFAVAALAANFTFFGLLDGSNFAVPILAVVGGVAAFFLTMLIAEKAGGSSTNFVLAGVVVGLAFSSMMTIMLTTANSDKLHGALSWLYGSFANMGWETVWLVFFPALFMSLVSLIWAKELNLVLLGEDQAQQMGLNVRRFNRWMLIFASILTSVCVAFVGIIGFVGLVVPHVCRMILGGDHRLVLPASIVMGGALMLFADLLARMIMIPQELPVGAITTVIGVPLFAYLLIKRGRMYDG